LIEEALSTMNPKLRAALVLREIEGSTYEEISEILGVFSRYCEIAYGTSAGSARKATGGPYRSIGGSRLVN
jgi:hypothetical protein